MTASRARLDRLAKFYGSDAGFTGSIVLISPNGWPDFERDAYFAGRHDAPNPGIPIPDVATYGVLDEAALDAVERVTGVRPRGRDGEICVIAVPAPEEIAEADDATRRAWTMATQRVRARARAA
jgi:hypothetical protein